MNKVRCKVNLSAYCVILVGYMDVWDTWMVSMHGFHTSSVGSHLCVCLCVCVMCVHTG